MIAGWISPKFVQRTAPWGEKKTKKKCVPTRANLLNLFSEALSMLERIRPGNLSEPVRVHT